MRQGLLIAPIAFGFLTIDSKNEDGLAQIVKVVLQYDQPALFLWDD